MTMEHPLLNFFSALAAAGIQPPTKKQRHPATQAIPLSGPSLPRALRQAARSTIWPAGMDARECARRRRQLLSGMLKQ